MPPPYNHSVEPPEYEVHPQLHQSQHLQGLHPYLYIGLSCGSQWSTPGDPPVRVCSSGPSDRFPACHLPSYVDGISLIWAAIDQCGNGHGSSWNRISRTPLVVIHNVTEDGPVGGRGISLGGDTINVARGHCSSGRLLVHCRDPSFNLSSCGFQPDGSSAWDGSWWCGGGLHWTPQLDIPSVLYLL